MGKIEIEVPDGYEVKVVKKEDEFKDGDVLYVKCKYYNNEYVFIHKNSDTYRKTNCYCNIRIGSYKIGECIFICEDENICEIRKANEYERNIIIDALKRDKKYDILKRFFNIDLNPEIKTYQDLIDNNIKIKGSFIGVNSNILTHSCKASKKDSNVAISEKVAKSMLAMAMISQLMPYYGGEITDYEWSKGTKVHIIARDYLNKIVTIDAILHNYYFLAFHTIEQRDEFLKNNEQLVKDYLMID